MSTQSPLSTPLILLKNIFFCFADTHQRVHVHTSGRCTRTVPYTGPSSYVNAHPQISFWRRYWVVSIKKSQRFNCSKTHYSHQAPPHHISDHQSTNKLASLKLQYSNMMFLASEHLKVLLKWMGQFFQYLQVKTNKWGLDRAVLFWLILALKLWHTINIININQSNVHQ